MWEKNYKIILTWFLLSYFNKNYQTSKFFYNIRILCISWYILTNFPLLLFLAHIWFSLLLLREEKYNAGKYLRILKSRARCSSDDDGMQVLCEGNRMRQETNCTRSMSSDAAIQYSQCYCRPNDLIVAVQKICSPFSVLFIRIITINK